MSNIAALALGELPTCDAFIRVHLRAIGGAPQLKKAKFRAPVQETWSTIVSVLRRSLKLSDEQELYTYLWSAFHPEPYTTLGGLAQSYASGGELVVSYSTAAAYRAR